MSFHMFVSTLQTVILSLIILVLSFSLASKIEADVPTVERDALVVFYNSTFGDDWRSNANWLSGDPCTNNWFGLTCNVSNTNVIQIDLGQSSLAGRIPSAIKHLSQMQSLYLHSNSLTGPIPSELGDLSQLQILWLNANSLTGSVPGELRNLSQLTNLRLADNELCGVLPTSLVNLTNLANGSGLDINNNNLITTVGPVLDAFLTLKSSDYTDWKTTQNSQQCFSWTLFLPAIISNTRLTWSSKSRHFC